ncbi:MAG: iron-containing alcohol dehydrogenase [Deltaproteobacteria bacterium]|nr:iron-containing alcohol dehydrogenase [Deltaproteobacteria bacterium]
METVINLPPEVRFGFGALDSLVPAINRLGNQRILIVTDQGVVKSGLIQPVVERLEKAGLGYTIFDKVRPNPTVFDCLTGLDIFREHGGDVLIAVGGGSPMDAAKVIQLMATHTGDVAEYDVMAGGVDKINRHLPPMIAVPTTSGTGSEVSAGAVVTEETRNQKIVIVSPYLLPGVAIVDPEMTMGLPPNLTASTGADALTHCIEVYVSINEEPLVEAMMLFGIELCGKYLARVVADGSDREARKWMAFASTVGGMGINVKGLGASHSLSHQLSTDHGIPHGLANAIMLPHVMRFNLDYAEPKYARMAVALGAADVSSSVRDKAEKGINAVDELFSGLGLNLNLASYGVSDDSIEKMSAKAMNDPCHSGNPRPCDQALMKAMYLAALERKA